MRLVLWRRGIVSQTMTRSSSHVILEPRSSLEGKPRRALYGGLGNSSIGKLGYGVVGRDDADRDCLLKSRTVGHEQRGEKRETVVPMWTDSRGVSLIDAFVPIGIELQSWQRVHGQGPRSTISSLVDNMARYTHVHDIHSHPAPFSDFALIIKSHIIPRPKPFRHLDLGRIENLG